MRVLVTGGAGYIGSVVCQTLLDAGHQVLVYDCLKFGGRSLLGLWPREGFAFARGDIRDVDSLSRAMDGQDAIVHLAAIVGDPACAREPVLARSVNFDGSVGVWKAARDAGVRRFVFASTCSNYGKMANSNILVDETAELRPVSLYAETKVAFENHLLEQANGDTTPKPTILRFATAFGISPRMRFDLTVNEFTMELATTGRLKIYGEQFWRPYVHVRDIARAVALVLSDERVMSHRVFNIGDDTQNFQKGSLVEIIRQHVATPVEIDRVQSNEDPRDYRVSFALARNVLGLHISRTVADGVAEILNAVQQGVFGDCSDPAFRN